MTSLKRSDIIAYRLIERGGRRTPYYQGRVMHYDDDARLARLKPPREERVTVAGELFFKMNKPAPKPFSKLGELEATWLLDPADDGADASQTGCVTEVRLIGGRSVGRRRAAQDVVSRSRVRETEELATRSARNDRGARSVAHRTHTHSRETDGERRKWDERIARGAHEHRNAGVDDVDRIETNANNDDETKKRKSRRCTVGPRLRRNFRRNCWRIGSAGRPQRRQRRPRRRRPQAWRSPTDDSRRRRSIVHENHRRPTATAARFTAVRALERRRERKIEQRRARATRRRARASTAAAMATFRSSGDIE